MRPMQSTRRRPPHAVLFIVFFLQGFNFASEVPIGIHQTTELHESAHMAMLTSTARDAREHGYALFGEGVRTIAASTAALFEVTICDLKRSSRRLSELITDCDKSSVVPPFFEIT